MDTTFKVPGPDIFLVVTVMQEDLRPKLSGIAIFIRNTSENRLDTDALTLGCWIKPTYTESDVGVMCC